MWCMCIALAIEVLLLPLMIFLNNIGSNVSPDDLSIEKCLLCVNLYFNGVLPVIISQSVKANNIRW